MKLNFAYILSLTVLSLFAVSLQGLTQDNDPQVTRQGMIDRRDLIISIKSETLNSSASADQLQLDTVEIIIDAQGTEISGFDLTFAFDPDALEFVEAVEGSFLDSCGWEYFVVREDPRCAGPCPKGLLKIIALSEFQSKEKSKVCFAPFAGSSLARLVFRPNKPGPAVIRFFWIDCGDNSVSSVSGNDLFISRSVIDSDSTVLTSNLSAQFPNYGGPTAECFEKLTVNPPTPKINFVNGLFDVIRVESPVDTAR